MKKLIRRAVTHTPLYGPMRDVWRRYKQKTEYREWLAKGKPVPVAHIAKQKALKVLAEEHGIRVLVETGTYYGDMVAALKHGFDQIYSIELSRPLYEMARKRFRRERHVELIHGDSGAELERLICRLNRRTLFWLDGHYSAGETARGACDTPIYQELEHIFNATDFGHVIVVDDARHFGSDPAYPSIDALREFVAQRRPEAEIVIENDSIRILPPAAGSPTRASGAPRACPETTKETM